MPHFVVELERSVSRVVELRQTTSVIIEAPHLMAATFAAEALKNTDELDDYRTAWIDDEKSQGYDTHYEVLTLPKLARANPTKPLLGGPIYNAMPEDVEEAADGMEA